MPDRSPRSEVGILPEFGGLPDPLYASNGARPDAAHFDASVERVGKFRWRWSVVHWPETYNGRDGRQYPAIDWRDTGTCMTREAARRCAESAIRRYGQEEEWEETAEEWTVPDPRRIPTGDGSIQ